MPIGNEAFDIGNDPNSEDAPPVAAAALASNINTDNGGGLGNDPVDIGNDPLSGPAAPVQAGDPVPSGGILFLVVFTFPVPPGQDPLANTGQSVSVQMLNAGGTALQDYLPGLAADVGESQYQCLTADPAGFTGSARGILTTGLNAGQTDTQPVNLGTARALAGTDYSAGPPMTNLSAATSVLVAGSAGTVSVLVTGECVTGPPADPTGNPVQAAIFASGEFPSYLPASWLTVASGPAAGNYAQVSIAPGSLAAGAYEVVVQINGDILLLASDVLVVE